MDDDPDDPVHCWHHECGSSDAPHEVTWKCAAGHRFTPQYCTAHIGPAVERAMAAARAGDYCVCARCPGEQEMRPAMEGAA